MTAHPIKSGLRIFTAGHSFHVFMPPILAQIVESARIPGHVSVGMSVIGGSRVAQHWDLPDETNPTKAALKTGKVDVLTLSPIWMPDEGMEKFATLGVEFNPDLRVTVQEYWLPNDEFVPAYPLQTGKIVDHNAATVAGLRQCHAQYFEGVEAEVSRINQKLGRPTISIVPVGQAVVALRERIIGGVCPGIRTQSELFTDSWGHATAPIQVLSSYCHFTVIYKQSPVGLGMPAALTNEKFPSWADPKLNRVLQELAWDAVVHHPMSGVR